VGSLLEVLEVPEVMCCVLLCMLLCMLEALKGGICLCEVLEVMHSVLLCMLETAGGGLGFGVSKFPLWQFLVTVRHRYELRAKSML